MKRHFTCKSNWTGVIIAYTLKREYGLNKEDIDAYNIFNNGVAFANASYITTPGNTEGVQGWCWGLFHKYDSSLPYVSWRTNEDINDIRRTVFAMEGK